MSETDTNGQTELGLQALLVSLRFTLPRQSRLNKEESEKVEDSNHAQRGVAKVSTYYFQQETIVNGKKETLDALAPIKSHFNAWKKEHRLLTKPWDEGTGILPVVFVQRYIGSKLQFEARMPELLEEFRGVHPDWKTTGPERMGAFYKEQDFPSSDECMEDIGWSCAMIPMPTGEQFKRIKLISPNLAQDMEQMTNERVVQAVQEGRMSAWKDLIEPVRKIVEVLSKDKPRIFETLIGNLNLMLELAPAFQLGNDDLQMNAFVTQAKEDLSAINADDLRSDPAIRQSTLKSAQSLLAAFGEMGKRSFIT